jgi:hypothetical protein
LPHADVPRDDTNTRQGSPETARSSKKQEAIDIILAVAILSRPQPQVCHENTSHFKLPLLTETRAINANH